MQASHRHWLARLLVGTSALSLMGAAQTAMAQEAPADNGGGDEIVVTGIRASLESATAIKRVIAWQIAQEMKAQHITKTAMAARMKTSRAALNRLLDETDTSLTLATLASAAAALGKRLSFELVPA